MLQQYLQHLVHGHSRVLFSKPVLSFLRVMEHDVVAVSAKLARHLRVHGARVLLRSDLFRLTPNQCWCVARRRLLPLHARVPSERMNVPSEFYGTGEDLPNLFDFLQNIQRISLRPKPEKEAAPEDGI